MRDGLKVEGLMEWREVQWEKNLKKYFLFFGKKRKAEKCLVLNFEKNGKQNKKQQERGRNHFEVCRRLR